jgi:HEPN domain-containing protein
MSGPDPTAAFEEARRWIVVADRDLASIALCLSGSSPQPGSAAFFCQQPAEKMMKALLVASGIDFPKTHDLDKLSALASSAWPEFGEHIEACRALTPWRVEFRYPSSGEAESLPDVREVEAVRGRLGAFRTALVPLVARWSA